MSMQLTIIDHTQPADCTFRNGEVCLRASTLANTMADKVVPTVCHLTCPTYGGPYCGATVTAEAEQRWAVEMLSRNHGGTLRKIVSQFGQAGASFVAPDADLVAAVRAAFAPFASRSWYRGIGLTGSCIIAGATPADVDVRLVVSDLSAYLADRPDRPAKIGGRSVDLWVGESFATAFATIDLDTGVLHTSSLFAAVAAPEGMQVVDSGLGPMGLAAAWPAKAEQSGSGVAA